MSVYSMTGFAIASAGGEAPPVSAAEVAAGSAARAGGAVQVEIRSVNSRFLDLAFRMPDEFRGLEPALRELLTQGLKRGKVELRIATAREADSAWPDPRPEQLMRLARLESTVLGWTPQATRLSVDQILHWCRGGTATEPPEGAVMQAAQAALAGLKDARAREGSRLATLLRERTAGLRQLAAQAQPLVGQVVARQRDRFLERWNEALAHAGGGSAPLPSDSLRERALAEAAAYALRIDVAEELGRLQSHLDEIDRLLERGGELGKRLDFLIQELQREANTLGSKSTALELTGISVEMKVLVEQMREQVQNIE
jgi:uncharacterized protein (TIGR00255 family)